MKNFVQPGDALTVPSATARVAGTVFVEGKLFGVVANSTAAGEDVVINTCGVYDLAKGSETFALGAYVYATSAGVLAATASGNTLIGVAVKAAATGDAVVRVKLNEAN